MYLLLKKNDNSIAVDQKNPRGGFGWGRSMIGWRVLTLTRSYHVGWMKFVRGLKKRKFFDVCTFRFVV